LGSSFISKVCLVSGVVYRNNEKRPDARDKEKIITEPTEVGDVVTIEVIEKDRVVGPVEVGDVVASICEGKSEERPK